ncbi:hypothetical protein [Mycobacterium sp. OTB74]|uniref:hypothetical protein n=1 Tax=Mycobacterium sp. OTB74 TaxID=1853452 RepID=UPI0024772C78|nr:hypothetical protein [Mycobacterium sp. OTB74]MDH6243754.1 hypothetical protein [Mycobacterium sp. OTB74]
MGIQPDSSPYGSQTVTGPGWPNVEEEQLQEAAAHYQKLATKITGSVVPRQHSQLMSLTDQWTGAGSSAAAGEAGTIIGGHEANGAQAAAIAAKLQTMVASVIKTKNLVNATAEEVQQECMALSAAPFPNVQELIQSRIKMGLSENTAAVTASATEVANAVGAPPSIPMPGVPPQVAQTAEKTAKSASKGGDQMGQMMGQMMQMAGQVPQMLGQLPQQMMQPLQQLSQPLQQLTSLFQGGGQSKAGLGASPFNAFSNHPLAGGSGAAKGAGLMKGGMPGGGGEVSAASAQTPLLAKMVGAGPAATAVPAGVAQGSIAAGAAPVTAAAGMGVMGAMGGMGQRGSEGGGGRISALAVPDALDHGSYDEDTDDDW